MSDLPYAEHLAFVDLETVDERRFKSETALIYDSLIYILLSKVINVKLDTPLIRALYLEQPLCRTHCLKVTFSTLHLYFESFA